MIKRDNLSFRSCLTLLCCGLLLFISACDDDNPTDTAPTPIETVNGTIKDAADNPVAEAVIEARIGADNVISRDTTDNDGAFTLNNLPENLGDVALHVSHQEFGSSVFPLEEAIDETEGQSGKTRDIILKLDDRCCGVITVCVTDAKDEKDLANVEVSLREKGKTLKTLKTNDEGKVEFSHVCEGDYDIRLAKDDYEVNEYEFSLDSCDTIRVERSLERKDDECCDATLTIKVQTKDGKALDNAEVKVRKGEKTVAEGKTNADGSVSFDELCEGEYNIRIELEGYQVQEFEIEKIKCEEERSITRTLLNKDECCKGILKIVVKDSKTGEAVADAKVNLWRGGKLIEDLKTNQDGEVIFDGLCEGGFGVGIIREGYEAQEFEVELDCDEEKEIERELTVDERCCDAILRVKVQDEDGKPLRNAEVKVRGKGEFVEVARTNADGVAVFDGLCEGAYDLRIALEGFQVHESEIDELKCGEDRSITRSLKDKDECCKGILRLKVTDSESGEAIANARVAIWRDGKVLEDPRSNEDGDVIIDGLCEGNYELEITAEGYQKREYKIEMGCDEDKSIERSLEAGEGECCKGSIRIVVKNKDNGEPLRNALVRLWQNEKILIEARTNGDGVVEFGEICEGNYFLDVLHEEFKGSEFPIEMGCNKEFRETVQLAPRDEECCDGSLRIVIRDANTEKPIKNAKVILWQEGKAVKDARSNENGVVEIGGICEGGYGVSVEAEEYDGFEFEVEVGCDKRVNKEVSLEPNDAQCCEGTIRLVVRDAETEKPIENAKVILWKDGKAIEDPRTNGDGVIEIDKICEGNYGISIEHEDYEGTEFEVKLDCNEDLRLERNLKPKNKDCCKGVIRIQVTDEDSGEAIANATVKLWQNGKLFESGKTNGDGIVVFDGLCEDDYGVDIIREGYKAIEFGLLVGCDETVEEERTLAKDECCEAALKLRLRDLDTEAVLADVEAEIKLDGKVVAEATSDDEGWLEVDELCAPATYVIVFTKDGYKEKTIEIGFKECKTFQETYRLEED